MLQDKYEKRPNPDELLEKIRKENRGKITVFLGAAAGVGKTYTMLEAAHDRQAEEINVVIGWVETHGRVETDKLVEGIVRIPAKTLSYRDKELKEMDIDAILAMKPELVLVDELAHTNVPGSRHVRRYQDVEELLEAGINVYTTLNIQHIESLNDVVAQITGVVVRETVPDYIVEQADGIQLIDIPPEELIKRLKEGKVYVPGQAEKALKKFFRPGNINALRELSLRFTASRVDQDLTEYMRSNKIEGPWPAAGRIMVCVSASPFSAQLIRAARRLASGMHAELLAVHIETAKRRFPMGEKERDRVSRNLRLAEELGGKTLTVVGDNLVQEMLDAARKHNVTAIVVGKPRHSRLWEFFNGSVVDTIIRESGGINIYVIRGTAEAETRTDIRTVLPSSPSIPWWQISGGIAMAAAVSYISWLLKPQFELVNIALLYFMPVLFAAMWWGRWPSYITALVSVLAFDFLFVPPIFDFSVHDIRHIWSFVIFLVAAFLVGGRTELLRLEIKYSKQREKSIRALYEFSREIAAVVDSERIACELASHAGETIGRDALVMLPDKDGKLSVEGSYCVCASDALKRVPHFPESEYAVATWAFQHGQVSGRSTETLPASQYLYVPLVTRDNIVGVFAVKLIEKNVAPEQRRLINAWAGLAAIAVERVNLAEQARQATLLVESDRLRTALFNSISHELRTPLATITGATSTLLDNSVVYSEHVRRELLETVQDGANRMERVIANLLDTARLESGMMTLKNDWCDIEDIIGTALRRIGEGRKKYSIKTEIESGLELIRADCVLLEQVLTNLIDNAMKYSNYGSTITIAANKQESELMVAVYDSGSGIPVEDLPHIFEKFFRAQQAKAVSGTGLGLSICKSIIEAHGGQVWAKNRPEGGAVVGFSVPIGEGNAVIINRAGERVVG